MAGIRHAARSGHVPGVASVRSSPAVRPPLRRTLLAVALATPATVLLPLTCAQAAASADSVVARAERAMGATSLKSIRFAASGTGSTFGQAYVPGGAWPKLNITSFARVYDYSNGSMREESARNRAEPTGGGAVPLMGTGEQRATGFVQGTYAWSPAGQGAVATPVALETRLHDLWTSPHGVLAAARRNKATVDFRNEGGKSLAAVSFTEPNVMAATAYIDEDGLVRRVEAKMPHPVTGDTLVVTRYDDYKSYGDVKFPARIEQRHFGQPTLDLQVREVEVNPTAGFTAPDNVKGFAERVASTEVAPGVWFLAGGSHNSVALEMKDHMVVVETPLYDGRSAAVLAEAKKLGKGKPVRLVINSHHHFDHAGGLRTAAAEGARLLVAADAKPYLEKTFANPNKVKPDMLAKSGRKAQFATYSGKTVVSDGSRAIEVHAIQGSVHAKSFTLIYLPKEKLLIEADAFTPAPGSPVPNPLNGNNVNLAENVERLKLDVDRILPLHGPVVPIAELKRVTRR